MSGPFTFYEFFAGGGMARAGLGEGWRCLFANDFDPAKTSAYCANWGGDHLAVGDVHGLRVGDLPGRADLAWASSPCQDLSLAGLRKGLGGARSSAFWGFWRLMQGLNGEGRAPRIIVIENVPGLATSHAGRDFTTLCEALADQGYRFGALEIDAASFLPQSRPRLFVVATREPAPSDLLAHSVGEVHGRRVGDAYARLTGELKAHWLPWRSLRPERVNISVADLLDDERQVCWHPPSLTERLLAQLSPLQRERLAVERTAGVPRIGMAYRRTRMAVLSCARMTSSRSPCMFQRVSGSSAPRSVSMGSPAAFARPAEAPRASSWSRSAAPEPARGACRPVKAPA